MHPDGNIQWGDNAQKLKHQEKVVELIKDATIINQHASKLKLKEEDKALFFALATTGKQLLLLAPNTQALEAWTQYAASLKEGKEGELPEVL